MICRLNAFGQVVPRVSSCVFGVRAHAIAIVPRQQEKVVAPSRFRNCALVCFFGRDAQPAKLACIRSYGC